MKVNDRNIKKKHNSPKRLTECLRFGRQNVHKTFSLLYCYAII